MKISSLLELEELFEEALLEHLGNLDAVDKELLKPLIGEVEKLQRKGAMWKSDQDLSTLKSYEKSHEVEERAKRSYVAPPNSKYARNTWQDDFDFGDTRKTTALHARIGRGSKLETHELTVTEAVEKLTEDKDYPALIVKINGKQVLLVTHARFIKGNSSKNAGLKESNSYVWRFTKEFLRKYESFQLPPVTGTRKFGTEMIAALKTLGLHDGGTVEAQTRLTDMFKLMAILVWCEEKGEALATVKVLPGIAKLPKLDVILITNDTERVEKHAARTDLKMGIENKPKTDISSKMPSDKWLSSAYTVQLQKLKANLAYRLNAHKNSKTKNLGTTEEMLQHIIDDGYVDKIVFMGKPFNLTNDRLNFNDLKLGNKGRGESYVEYTGEHEINWDDPNFKAARAEIKELTAKIAADAPAKPANASGTQEEYAEYWASERATIKEGEIYLKHGIVPKRLNIKLVLDGGKIVPFKIEMKFTSW
jgi:hypothetical protein